MNWRDIARNNLSAARLTQGKHARSTVSRAYYSLHAALTESLVGAGYVLPPNRQTPAHNLQAHLIGQHLAGRGAGFVREMRAITRRLYKTRLDADYNARVTVDQQVSLQAIRDAHRAFALLEVTP